MSPEIEIDFLILKILFCLLFSTFSTEVLRSKNMHCAEQENCLCVKPQLAKHEGSFLPEWNWISALAMHFSFRLPSLLRMALSVDSARSRWQRRGALSTPQALSESTPLLLSARAKPKPCLNTHRIVLPDSGRQWKDCKQASTVYSQNRIQTTKYTWVTFLPQNLLRQFHR